MKRPSEARRVYEGMPVVPDSGVPFGLRRWTVALAIATVTAAVSLAGFQALAARYHSPGIEYLGDRVELLRGTPEPADVLFVGTSVVYRGVDAARLNALASADGCRLTFYNLGLPAMSVAEFDLLLGMLGKGKSNRQVAFHPALYDGLTRADSRRAAWANRAGAAALAYASLSAPWTAVRLAQEAERQGGAWRSRAEFVRRWLPSILRVGEAAHWLLRDRPGAHTAAVHRLHRRNDGFLPAEEDPRIHPRRHAAFLEEVETWRTRVELARREAAEYPAEIPNDTGELPKRMRRLEESPGDVELQERLLGLVRRTGARPLAIFPPQNVYQTGLIRFYRDRLGEERVLEFGFDRHEEFLDPKLWFDRAHLNRAGARVLADKLYRHFC